MTKLEAPIWRFKNFGLLHRKLKQGIQWISFYGAIERKQPTRETHVFTARLSEPVTNCDRFKLLRSQFDISNISFLCREWVTFDYA